MSADDICGFFALSHVNGEKVHVPATLVLHKEAEDIFVFVDVQNKIKGKARYADGRLTGMLLSTMSTGSMEQMAVEDAIVSGFGKGFDVRKESKFLWLKQENNNLIFVEKFKASDLVGNHAIVSVDGQKSIKMYSLRIQEKDNNYFFFADIDEYFEGQVDFSAGNVKFLFADSLTSPDKLPLLTQKVIFALKKGVEVKKESTGFVLKNDDCTIQLKLYIEKEQLHGDFLIKAVNRNPILSDRQLTMSFEGDLNVNASITNNFRCAATLKNNLLKAEAFFALTRMMGTEDEMKVEQALSRGMESGFVLTLVGNKLTMEGLDVIELVKAAKVESTQGGPIFKGTYAAKCFKTEGNGLLFRIVNEIDHQWAFYNDTSDYEMHVRATFGKRSSITILGKSSLSKDPNGNEVVELTIEPGHTEMFIVGKVNGFKAEYSANPVK